MREVRFIVHALVVCAAVVSGQATTRAQSGDATPEDLGRAGEAQKLEAAVGASFDQTMARVGDVGPYLSLTVAARRLDASVAVGSLAIGSDDPAIAAGGADIELVIQPVKWPGASGERADAVGEPMGVRMGRYDGAAATLRQGEGRGPSHALNFVYPASAEADGVRVKAKVIAGGGETTEFDFTLELRGEPTAGTSVYTDYKREAARLPRRR